MRRKKIQELHTYNSQVSVALNNTKELLLLCATDWSWVFLERARNHQAKDRESRQACNFQGSVPFSNLSAAELSWTVLPRKTNQI